MVRLGMGALLAVGVATALGVTLVGCRAEKFVSPERPDLYKVPYDFAPEADLSGADLAPVDLSAAVDLALAPDDLDEHD